MLSDFVYKCTIIQKDGAIWETGRNCTGDRLVRQIKTSAGEIIPPHLQKTINQSIAPPGGDNHG